MVSNDLSKESVQKRTMNVADNDRSLNNLLQDTLRAIEKLVGIFKAERMIYLALGISAFVVLLYTIFNLIDGDRLDTKLLVLIFGSSGLITASSARTVFFFNRAFLLIENIVQNRKEI